ncbi:formyltransferase family protein [Streptomyces sp. RGM 3693]|uniref:formyltransferase family protein n=1 Tax=Streptomyces sp. RGM 3693 TaxID=3413284 RepID=UPI003D2777CC
MLAVTDGHRHHELRAMHIPDGVDLIVAAHSHAFIGCQTRARAAVATIGYRPSLLPLHRGRDAIRWTVRDGDKVTSGSVYHLTERTDGGPIAAQEHLFVPPGSTAQSLWREHLAPLGVRLLVRVVTDLAEAGGSRSRRTRRWRPGSRQWTRHPSSNPNSSHCPERRSSMAASGHSTRGENLTNWAANARTAAHRLRTGCAPAAHRLSTGCAPAAHRLSTGYVPTSAAAPPRPPSLHSGVAPAGAGRTKGA